MEILNANIFQMFCFELLAGHSSLIDISGVFFKFTKFPVVIASGGKDKDIFCMSRDHMINESRDPVAFDTLTLIHKGCIVRVAELNNKNIYYKYVLQIGASLCYKLGQLCFITNWGAITN